MTDIHPKALLALAAETVAQTEVLLEQIALVLEGTPEQGAVDQLAFDVARIRQRWSHDHGLVPNVDEENPN